MLKTKTVMDNNEGRIFPNEWNKRILIILFFSIKEIIGKYSGCAICDYRGVIKEGVLNLTMIVLVCCCIICTHNQSHGTSWCSSDLLCCCCHCSVTKSSPTLWTPWTKARQAPLFMRFPRQELWNGFHFLL